MSTFMRRSDSTLRNLSAWRGITTSLIAWCLVHGVCKTQRRRASSQVWDRRNTISIRNQLVRCFSKWDRHLFDLAHSTQRNSRHDVLGMTTNVMTDPIRILVKRDELTLEGIKQLSHSDTLDSSKFGKLSTMEAPVIPPNTEWHQHLKQAHASSYTATCSPSATKVHPLPVCIRNTGCLVIASGQYPWFLLCMSTLFSTSGSYYVPCDVQRLP